ncbi:hypothetical protein [Streptomyces noursei]|uniref:hypothetical protein n=1 Tax=Streptomyces noursei TaxID=1971 RepID=UPI001964540B|nr:hypothetical protein [Streptomyces noursei]QRX90635.1 hypothetical protein JNO44_07130 [Streptomyces noursei]
MDHVRWWGDVLAEDLFGPDVAARWMAARSAVDRPGVWRVGGDTTWGADGRAPSRPW